MNLAPLAGDHRKESSHGRWQGTGDANKIPYLRISVILLRRRQNGPAPRCIAEGGTRVKKAPEGGWLRPRMREGLRGNERRGVGRAGDGD